MANIDPIANGEAASGVRTKLNELITRSNECYPCDSGGGGGEIDADVIASLDVGAVSAGDTITAGSSLSDVIRQIFTATFYPTYIAPSASLTASLAANVESGTTADLLLTASLNRGQIRGAMIGGAWNATATQDHRAGAFVDAVIDGVTTAGTRTLTGYQVTDGANAFSATVNHGIGPQPLDSTGAPYQTPLAAGGIATSTTVTGRRARFHGTPAAHVSDSAGVRALSTSALNPSNGTTFTISVPVGAERVVFAYPATLREVLTVKYVEGLNAEVKGVFVETTVSVAGANGYSPINYRVYTYTPASAFSATATYTVTI